ncbi:MAG: aspartyl protease family protein [Bacteroidales bacterium]|nr:aspartyl protease family protein [Bacteroidales bacterium]
MNKNFSLLLLIFAFLLAYSKPEPMDSFVEKTSQNTYFQNDENTEDFHLQPSSRKKIIPNSMVVIPLKRAGNLLLIEATIDSISGNFILDTGAGGLVLNSTYFRDGKPVFDAAGVGVNQSNIERKKKVVDSIKFNTLVFKKLNADVINLGHIENSKGIKILGLLGSSFFKDFEMILDIRNSSLTLCPVDRKGNLLVEFRDTNHYEIEQKIDLINNVIITHIPIGGKKVCFCIDTGAENCLIDNQAPDELMQLLQIKGRKTLTGSGNKKVEVFFASLNELKIGEQSMDSMNVIITNLSTMSSGYGINIGGMLGFDFLNQGIIKININRKTLCISKYKEEKI